MKKKKRLLDNKGMTLVEVITAFVILLIGMSALVHATTLSLKIINKSQKTQWEADAAVSDYYKTISGETPTTPRTPTEITLVPEDGTGIGTMKVDLHTYQSPPASDGSLEGGRYLYYFRTGGDAGE